MSCEDILILLMGYVDDELEDDDRTRVEEHLKTCPACARELAGYRRLDRTLDAMSFVEPGDIVWENFGKRFTDRAGRAIGWLLTGFGVVLLIGYGLWALIWASDIAWVVKFGSAALAIGLMMLLVSVIRVRLRLRRVDKYKEVKR